MDQSSAAHTGDFFPHMDRSSAAAAHSSNSEAPFYGGDWSPRISFSHSFACIQRVPSPNRKSSLHDTEFEFSRSVVSDLLSADELFCDGKLRPFEASSSHESCAKRELKPSPRRKEAQSMGVRMASNKENLMSACEEDSICRRGWKAERNAGEAKSPTSREEPISACRRAEREAIGKKPADLTLPTGDLLSVSRTSREGLTCACNLQMGRKAGISESPTSRKEVFSAHKLEMGENAGKSRLPTSRVEEFMPAFKQEIGSKAGKPEPPHTSRENVLCACIRAENSEVKGREAEIKVPNTSRESSLSARSACETGIPGMPVKWREEAPRLWGKRNEDDGHVGSDSRTFGRHLRSASLLVEGSCTLGNRSCVSLNNSRCASPSRSFSLPSTTPASPSASNALSGFSSSSFSSSSSRYRSKIKHFFKLKKAAVPKEDTLPAMATSSPASSTCRLPISPRSLLAFFKGKESSKAGSRSSTSMLGGTQKAEEHVCASTKDVYGGANKEHVITKCKDLNALGQSPINPTININPSLTLPISAKPPPNPSFSIHVPPSTSTTSSATAVDSIAKTTQHASADCTATRLRAHKSHSFSHGRVVGAEGPTGPTMLVVDEGLWEEGSFKRKTNALNLHTHCPSKEEGSQRIIKKSNNMNNINMVVGSKGGGGGGQQYGRAKGLERPPPYTTSVRVTPVLNVPSCITPSLVRKTKLSSKPKTFSFENLNLFARRERALITPTSK